jgi:hypothetical protein
MRRRRATRDGKLLFAVLPLEVRNLAGLENLNDLPQRLDVEGRDATDLR